MQVNRQTLGRDDDATGLPPGEMLLAAMVEELALDARFGTLPVVVGLVERHVVGQRQRAPALRQQRVAAATALSAADAGRETLC